MRSSAIAQTLLSLFLIHGVPAAVIVRDEPDPDNPQAMNPKQPPQNVNMLPQPENPFKDGFQTAPASCTDYMKPTDQCLNDLIAQSGGVTAFSGGELKWDNDHKCDSDIQMPKLQTAAYEAHSLATYADLVPDGHNIRDVALWKTWIGPDYIDQQQRIADNLKRASEFKSKKTFDIILSCKDSKNQCGIKVDGKGVGGYAWTYNGWFGWYHYIVMCPVFFTKDNLEEITLQIQDDLRKGRTDTAEKASWHSNTGQLFLHEMMHLDSVGKPHITDEKVDPSGVGPRAYGNRLVYKLAQRSLNQGGGATRASTNADNYAWLANSKWFWDTTGYFPTPDGFRNVANIDNVSSDEQAKEQDGFFLDLGSITADTSDDEVQGRIKAELESMATPDPPQSPPKPPGGDIPSPQCATEGTPFEQPPVEDYITHACSDKQFWDAVITPPISTGTGRTSDGRGKALGVTWHWDLPGTSDKLWLGVTFKNDHCVGIFQFATGSTDDEKIESCRLKFRTVLNGCQTDTITEKKGGSLTKACEVYVITTAKEGVNPFDDWWKDQGDFTCEPTDVNGKHVCKCFYSGYPSVTDIFKLPDSGDCKDVRRADLLFD